MERLFHHIATTLVALSIMFAAHCQSESAQQSYSLLLFEATVYRTLGDTSGYIYSENDRNSLKDLEATLQNGNKLVAGFESRWPMVAKHWQILTRFVYSDLINNEQADLVKFPRRYEVLQQNLVEALNSAKTDTAEGDILADKKPLLMSLIHLEQVVAGYTFYNINVFGGLSVPETGIENYNDMFKAEVQNLKADDAALAKALTRKWRFIEKTVLDYNQRSAVFIVRRTASSLRTLIQTSISDELLAGESY